jgi:hypothetical protein
MDIDHLTDSAPAGSRRRLLTRAGGAGGTLAALLGLAESAAKKNGKHKRKKRKRTKGPSLRLAYAGAGPPDGYDLHPSGTRLAQTFVAGRRGTLRRVQVAIAKQDGSSGNWLVQVLAANDDTPSPSPVSVLAAVTMPDAEVPAGASVRTADVAGPGPVLEAGTAYAVAIWRDGDSPGLGYHDHTSGASCAGGQFSAIGAGAFSDAFQEEFDLVVSVFVA